MNDITPTIAVRPAPDLITPLFPKVSEKEYLATADHLRHLLTTLKKHSEVGGENKGIIIHGFSGDTVTKITHNLQDILDNADDYQKNGHEVCELLERGARLIDETKTALNSQQSALNDRCQSLVDSRNSSGAANNQATFSRLIKESSRETKERMVGIRDDFDSRLSDLNQKIVDLSIKKE